MMRARTILDKAITVKKETPKAQLAIFFYGVNSSSAFDGATRHHIENDIIQQGEYIEPNALLDLLSSKNSQTLSLKPKCILAEDHEHLVWFSKKQKRKMWFRQASSEDSVFSLNVVWPTLLFVANKRKNSLMVFALSSDSYPTEKTKIYHAPLMNISSTGVVCQGTAVLPKIITVACIEDVEATIYDSLFTHVNHFQTLTLGDDKKVSNTDHIRFWKKQEKLNQSSVKKFLVPFSSVGALLKTLKEHR